MELQLHLGFSDFRLSFTSLKNLLDTLVQGGGAFPLLAGLVLLQLEDVLLPLALISLYTAFSCACRLPMSLSLAVMLLKAASSLLV